MIGVCNLFNVVAFAFQKLHIKGLHGNSEINSVKSYKYLLFLIYVQIMSIVVIYKDTLQQY